MQREITFSKYRNIGIEQEESLLLNRTMKRGEMGGLVIVIGPNNAGKSNVLDGVSSLGAGTLQKRDRTELSLRSEDRDPHVSLLVHGKGVHLSCTVGLGKSKSWTVVTPAVPHLSDEDFKKELVHLASLLNQAGVNDENFKTLKDVIAKGLKEDSLEVDEVLDAIYNSISFSPLRWGDKDYAKLSEAMEAEGNYFKKAWGRSLRSDSEEADHYLESVTGLPFFPKIVPYEEHALSNRDLKKSTVTLSNSPFFTSLFRAIGVDLKEIDDTYRQYNSFHNVASFLKMKEKIAEKLAPVASEFNRLYGTENDPYSFSVSFDPYDVSFGLARGKGKDPIMLDYQSTGFKWFFNLFFNCLNEGTLAPGDIIVMDEPATHLHPQGQQELHRFLKEFAKKNDLTILIATHSPFLIDPDDYDELRVIRFADNRAHIDNLFTAVNMEDPDSLLPIKTALTIKQNVLYDTETQVVWVEGITDYCYLTLFKRLLGKTGISFIPFNGVGENDEAQKAILSRLSSVRFHQVTMLVDGDEAGRAMKKSARNTCFSDLVLVSDLSMPNHPVKEIEDLFSVEDRTKFTVLDPESTDTFKKANLASVMKDNATLLDFSPETIQAFTCLFSLLED